MKKAELEKNREEWSSRVKEWEASGLRPAEYCRRNNLKPSKFLYWKKRITGKVRPTSSFVRIPIDRAPFLSSLQRSSPIRIKIENRYCVEVDQGFDPASLEYVIGVLSRL